MPVRNKHRVGDYLVEDDESGIWLYRSQVREAWDGSLRHWKHYEDRHPQEFVRAKADPYPLTNTRPAAALATPANVSPVYVGSTTVPAPQGPVYHVYDLGIGSMKIGSTFVVR